MNDTSDTIKEILRANDRLMEETWPSKRTRDPKVPRPPNAAAKKRIADLERELAAKDAEIAGLQAKRTRAAYWHNVADMLSVEKYGHPCDADPDVEAWKAELAKPLVDALVHAKTRLESLVRLICEKPEPHSNLDAAHNSARRLAIEEVAALDAALAPHKAATCPTCKGTRVIMVQYGIGYMNQPCPDCAGKGEPDATR